MHQNDPYPRTLMVVMTKVKAEDAGNLLIRKQFGEWPKHCLAQIYSGETEGRGEFCGCYYHLQAADRFLGGLFHRLRGGVLGMVALDAVDRHASRSTVGPLRRCLNVLKKQLGDWLIDSGLWELIFRTRISQALHQFVESFKPDLIFCEGYSLGFTSLPLLLAARFGVPIAFQTTDDWPLRAYRHSPVGWLLRRRARELMRRASVRLAFGGKMQREYQLRYGVPFGITYHLDEPTRFPEVVEAPDNVCRIIYTGNLGHRRHEAIHDLLTAVRQIPETVARFELLIYTSGIPRDASSDLLQAPEVKFETLPTHAQLPAVLASASILFLPESFTEPRQAIELSISTKAHLYMMSRRPVLVYGPCYSGTVDYAIREGWALVVSDRKTSKLTEAIRELLAGNSRKAQIRANAEVAIRQHHDLTTGRERFRMMLSEGARADGRTCSSMGSVGEVTQMPLQT